MGDQSEVRSEAQGLRIGLLGPLSVRGDGIEVTVAAPLQQALVVLLALDGGSASTAQLIDGLWGEALPDSPAGALQIAISRLRRHLAPAGGQVSSDHGRYRLAGSVLTVDVAQAEQHLDGARAASRASDPTAALAQAQAALALWRGVPLTQLERFPFHRWARPRLVALHADLVEERNDALLALGRHLEVIDVAAALVAQEPWRERLWAQQMLALYRAGRQVEALRAYDQLRTALADEVGIQPSPAVVALQTRILQQDPALDVIHLAHRDGRVPSGPSFTSTATPFVGREAELDQVAERWRQVRSGDGPHLLVVEGEPGIGKTRLATQVSGQLGRDGIALAGRWIDTLGHPHEPFVAMLRHLAAHLSERDAARVLPPEATSLHRLVAGGPPAPPAGPGEDGVARARLMAEMAAAFAAASRLGPLFLLLDDTHRAPPVALEVVEHILATGGDHRILVVATARGNVPDRSPGLAELVDRIGARASVLPLAGLSPDETRTLCDHVGPETPEALRRQVHGASGGNPFFATEILRDLRDAGAGPGGGTPTAADARDAIAHRVARLGPATGQVLQVAALAGSTFSVRALVTLLPAGGEAVRRALDRAVAAQLVEPDRGDDHRFLHDLTRQSIEESIPPAERERWHARLARWCASVDAPAATVVGQWLAAGPGHDRDLVLWARRAGDEALGQLDVAAAARWHREALDRAQDPRERHEILIDLGRAQFLAGDPAHRDSQLAAGSWARAHADDDLLVAAALAAATDWASDTVVDQDRVDLLVAAAAVAVEPSQRCRILATLSVELAWEPDPARRHRLADEAVAAGRRSGDPRDLANALTARVFARWGSAIEARVADAEEALAVLEDLDDPVAEHNAVGSRMAVAVEVADLGTVDRCLARSVALVEAVPLPLFSWGTALHQAWRQALDGDLDAAEGGIARARDLGARSGQASAASAGASQLLYLRWQQGRLAEQVPLIEQAAAFGLPVGYCAALRAAAMVEVGELEAARATLVDHASRAFADLPPGMLWSAGMVAWGQVVAATPDVAAAAVLADLLAPWRNRVAFAGAWVLGPLAVPLARARAGAGDEEGARAAARTALRVARDLGGAPWLVPADVVTLADGADPAG